jgi:hypothetical protein
MLFALIGILTSLVSLAMGTAFSVMGLALNALIAHYLTRSHVKAFFGRPPEIMPAGQTN